MRTTVRFLCAARVAAALSAIGGLAPPTVDALTTPASAESHARAMPPDLVDHPALLQVHPQRAADLDQMLLLTSGSEYFTSGFHAAVLGTGDLRGYLTTSREWSEAVRTSGIFVHGGTAVRRGMVRFGVGAAIGYARDKWTRDDVSLDGDLSSDVTDRKATQISGIFGFGLEGSRGRVDLSCEVYRNDIALHTRDLSPTDTTEFRLVSDPPIVWQASIRTRLPIRDRVTLRAVGSYRDRTVSRSVEGFDDAGPYASNEREYAHSWTAGLSAEVAATERTATHVFGHYENSRPPATDFAYRYSGVERTNSSVEIVTFGVSLEKSLWRHVRLVSGFRSDFHVETSLRESERYDGTMRAEKTVEEWLSHAFGWGLSGRWRQVALVGSMRKDLAIGELFGQLDAAILF